MSQSLAMQQSKVEPRLSITPVTKNRILQKLTPADLAAVTSCLSRVELTAKQEIISRGDLISYVYFPEDCVVSVLAKANEAAPIEVGMFGFEGMSEMACRPGDRTALTSIVQISGTAWRIKAEDFIRLIMPVTSLHELASRFREATAIQFAYAALANGSFKIEQRLARWLLMSQDRAQSDTVPVIHAFIALMLDVRRSGVTTATHVLEGAGAIKAHRNAITVRDRSKLLQIAGDCYGVPEAEYERLMAS